VNYNDDNVTSHAYLAQGVFRGDVPIVIDTGCSHSVTPFIEDFTGPITPILDDTMGGLKNGQEVKIAGEGWVEWPIRDIFNRVTMVRTKCYHVPEGRIRLFSTQTYFQEIKGGTLSQDHEKVIFTAADGQEMVFNYQPSCNLPLMFLELEPKQAGLSSKQAHNMTTSPMIEQTLTLLDDNNYNLTKPQKELLLWHYRLGHAGFQWIQDLMRPRKQNVGDTAQPAVISTKTTGAANCVHPKCPACQLAKQHRRPTGSQKKQDRPESEMAIRRNNLKPGECISIDQYISRTPGRLPSTRGKESLRDRYSGGTLFVDHATALVFIKNQISLRVGETLQGKHEFERYAEQHGVKVKSYHADNHPFGAKEFLEDLELQDQTITYSGVGAHFQNGVAERTLGTITSWALAMMMHMCLHYPEQFDEALWPYALEHAVTLWNHMPKSRSGLSPIELFTGAIARSHDIVQNARVWSSCVYTLDPKLQDNKKLPKWTRRSRRGVYLGVSPSHASTVGRILNVRTGAITPQYHVVYDELFSTVQGTATDGLLDETLWNDLIRLNGIEHTLSPEDLKGEIAPIDTYYKDFVDLTGEESDDEDNGATSNDIESEFEVDRVLEVKRGPTGIVRCLIKWRGYTHPTWEPISNLNDVARKEAQSLLDSSVSAAPEGDAIVVEEEDVDMITDNDVLEQDEASATEIPHPIVRRSKRLQPSAAQAGTYYSQQFSHTPRRYSSQQAQCYMALGNPNQKVLARDLQSQMIQGLVWSPNIKDLRLLSSKRALFQMLCSYSEDDGTLEAFSPMALATLANDVNQPNWHQAMNGPDREGYWKAMEKEIKTLEDMEVWEVVPKQPWMRTLKSTWSYLKKLYPDGRVRKLKARACCRGDMQIEGVHFFETYSPVVNWTTVRLMLILTAQLGLATKQIDYTSAFAHADIDLPPGYDKMSADEQSRQGVFIEMFRGFRQDGMVLKLKKSLYGLRQSSRNFFSLLKSNLEAIGFEQALDVDPCLFISDTCICLTYVDDCLLYSRTQAHIDQAIAQLRAPKTDHEGNHLKGMVLDEEDDVAGFLGVHIERSQDQIKLTQKGLTQRIVDALQVNDLPAVSTPADIVLGKDIDGDSPNCSFNYASVVGMMWYLYSHSRPDLGFALSQVSRFSFNPKRSHELALIRIGQYLKGTLSDGLIMKPMSTDHFTMDCYVDADFLGKYGSEARTDPDNVKSRTGFVICLNDCPIVWTSKLQEAISLSSMMSEYYALSAAMREVLPLRSLIKAVAAGIGLEEAVRTTFKTTIWEDNMGALTLANLDEGRSTPRSKFYDSKVHWFRSHISGPSEPEHDAIKVCKIGTSLQLADIYTKPLNKDVFVRLRKLLLGW
jgi:hypothetical protein